MNSVNSGLLFGALVVCVIGLTLIRLAPRTRARRRKNAAHTFADLAPCHFFEWLDDREPKLKAVGWLAKNSPYRRGKSDPTAFQRLLTLLASPWSPACLPRRMECPFCPIIDPNHGKKKQPWWVLRKGVADGIQLIETQPPEALAHLEAHRLSRSGLRRLFHSATLFVPADGFVFVAHPMIGHFVDAHGYNPPDEFWKAVKQCADMRSILYRQALIDNGPQNKTWLAAIWAGQQEWDLTTPSEPKKT